MTHIVEKFVHGKKGELPRRSLKNQMSVATRVVLSRSQRKVKVTLPTFKCQQEEPVE